MKIVRVVVALLLSLIFAQSVFAASQQYYVSDTIHTYLRKGDGDKYRISGAITAGTPVTILQEGKRYSLIKDDSNRQGWILNNELSTTKSPRDQLPELKNKIQELTLKLNKLDDEWQQRTAEIQRRLKSSEAQSSQLLEQNSQLKRQNSNLEDKNQSLENLLDADKRAIILKWFIYGGAVLAFGLFLGIILPLIIPRRRRRNGWS